jgi:glutaredoxin 3
VSRRTVARERAAGPSSAALGSPHRDMKAVLYTWKYCPFCVRAKEILEEHEIPYTEHVMDGKPAELDELKRRYGHPTVPIILLDGNFIGGCDSLEQLADSGGLS